MVIWCIFPIFGMLYQEKSGNPVPKSIFENSKTLTHALSRVVMISSEILLIVLLIDFDEMNFELTPGRVARFFLV
jgi:hypothetical protein